MSVLPEAGAFSFRNDQTLDEIWRRLRAESALEWQGRDSDLMGEYIIARLGDGSTKLRLFKDGDRYVLAIGYLPPPEGPTPLQQILDRVEREVLPLLGARDIQPHSGWE
jgi:hypothetical protein